MIDLKFAFRLMIDCSRFDRSDRSFSRIVWPLVAIWYIWIHVINKQHSYPALLAYFSFTKSKMINRVFFSWGRILITVTISVLRYNSDGNWFLCFLTEIQLLKFNIWHSSLKFTVIMYRIQHETFDVLCLYLRVISLVFKNLIHSMCPEITLL